jgi:cation diffusion facilitator CzcD-associated flavoprotein CzcO
VAIVGAGFGGIGVGIALKRKGIDDFVIFEGEPGVGGSWRTNTYPGCACDVPSHLYSYSFEPNPDWTESFSGQADIQRYIEHCADRYDIRRHVRFNTRVTSARFDAAEAVWHVSTSDGQVTKARIFVPATGALSHPAYPEITGRDSFAGPALHTARWDASVDLTGKRVGVIGSGASAIQVVPAIAPKVGKLSVFQRTASWVLPKRNQRFSDAQHARWKRLPAAQRAARLAIYWAMESALPALMWYPRMLRVGEVLHKRALRRAIQDPELRRKLTPTYKVGCKRTLVSDDWFPAFARDNVQLITEGIERITPKGVVTKDGATHEVDVLVYATGYQIGAPAYPFEVHGLHDRELRAYWGARSKAYYGMSVSGFPNMFLIMGPNTGPGHTSVLIYQEAQYEYVAKFAQRLFSGGEAYFDVKEDVLNAQWEKFQKRMAGSSWLSGCTSWYLNPDGSNSTMWPGFSFEYVLQMKDLHLDAYDVTPAKGR